MKLLDKKKLWNLGYVELWDFSKANSSQEAREEACALIGGACRNVIIKNPKQFYQRLLTEHDGNPSEILQFIPFTDKLYESDLADINTFNKFTRFAYIHDKIVYTNARNTINYGGKYSIYDLIKTDCSNFVVFRTKIPYMIVDHLRRHKLLSSMFAENWQSNRSKHDIEYFENDEIKHLIHLYSDAADFPFNTHDTLLDGYFTQADFRHILQNKDLFPIRSELINKGEFGLRYVTGWIGGWLQDPAVWDNFFGVRTKNPTQKETQELSRVMLEMLEKHHGYTMHKY